MGCCMSTYTEVSNIFVIITSIGMVYALYAQGLKMWRRRSVRDIHPAMSIAPVVNEIVWVNYGIATRDWFTVVACTICVGACLLITSGYLKYRKGSFDKDVVEGGLGI